jgi:hypothetical protein
MLLVVTLPLSKVLTYKDFYAPLLISDIDSEFFLTDKPTARGETSFWTKPLGNINLAVIPKNKYINSGDQTQHTVWRSDNTYLGK